MSIDLDIINPFVTIKALREAADMLEKSMSPDTAATINELQAQLDATNSVIAAEEKSLKSLPDYQEAVKLVELRRSGMKELQELRAAISEQHKEAGVHLRAREYESYEKAMDSVNEMQAKLVELEKSTGRKDPWTQHFGPWEVSPHVIHVDGISLNQAHQEYKPMKALLQKKKDLTEQITYVYSNQEGFDGSVVRTVIDKVTDGGFYHNYND